MPPAPLATVCRVPAFIGPSGINEPPPCSGTPIKMLLQLLVIYVTEMDIIKIHAADFFQLLFYPAPDFQSIFQDIV